MTDQNIKQKLQPIDTKLYLRASAAIVNEVDKELEIEDPLTVDEAFERIAANSNNNIRGSAANKVIVD